MSDTFSLEIFGSQIYWDVPFETRTGAGDPLAEELGVCATAEERFMKLAAADISQHYLPDQKAFINQADEELGVIAEYQTVLALDKDYQPETVRMLIKRPAGKARNTSKYDLGRTSGIAYSHNGELTLYAYQVPTNYLPEAVNQNSELDKTWIAYRKLNLSPDQIATIPGFFPPEP